MELKQTAVGISCRTAVAVVGLGFAAWITAPAQAARFVLDEIVRVSDSTGSNGDVFKSLSVQCPAGMSVISGGVSVGSSDPVADVLAIARSEPMDLPSQGWFAYAYETSPEIGDWSLAVTAVCVEGADLIRVESESAVSSSGLRVHSAQCPPGLEALGGGFSINSPFLATSFAASGSLTNLDGTGWDARAHEVIPSSADWSLEVTAICGELGNQRAIHAPFASANGSRLLLRTDCPLGQVMISPGATLLGTAPTSIILKQIPANSPSITAALFESGAAAGGSWSARLRARCLELAVFADGFESGDIGDWSSSLP